MMADVPRNRETVSVRVDKHSTRPDLKETTKKTSASHPSAHQPSAPPQHLVSTAAEDVSLWVKVSWRLKRNFPVFYDTVAELLMLWVIMSLRQTAPINTNIREHVFINIYAGNQRLQRSQRPHESMHDPSAAWPGQTNADWEKDDENRGGIAVQPVLELNVPPGLSLTGHKKGNSGFFHQI